MHRVLGYRVAIAIIGALIGVVLPLLVLGPFVIHDLSLVHASTHEIALASILFVLGLWFVVLSFLADGNVIETVVATFEVEAVLLIVPYLIYAMSRSVFNRIIARRGNGAL